MQNEIWAAMIGWTGNNEIGRYNSEEEAIEAAKEYAETNDVPVGEMTVKPVMI